MSIVTKDVVLGFVLATSLTLAGCLQCGVNVSPLPSKLAPRGAETWTIDGQPVAIRESYFRRPGATTYEFVIEWDCTAADCGPATDDEVFERAAPVLKHALRTNQYDRPGVLPAGTGIAHLVIAEHSGGSRHEVTRAFGDVVKRFEDENGGVDGRAALRAASEGLLALYIRKDLDAIASTFPENERDLVPQQFLPLVKNAESNFGKFETLAPSGIEPVPIGVVWVVYEGKGAKGPMHHLVKVVGSKRDGYRAVGFWMSATPDGRQRMPIPPELSGDILDGATPR